MGQRIQLPTPANPPLPSIDVSVTLDGALYTLSLVWNETQELWFMSVLDNLGQTVLMGDQAMISEWPLYASRIAAPIADAIQSGVFAYFGLRIPRGYFLVRDTGGTENATLAGLGLRWQLWYLEAAEVAAAGVT